MCQMAQRYLVGASKLIEQTLLQGVENTPPPPRAGSVIGLKGGHRMK